jgi:hypothetical protein
MSTTPPASDDDLDRIVGSARRLGIEMNAAEAQRWLDAMADAHSVSTADLDHFRRLGRLVEIEDVPGVVETALALSGSAAQSKFQTFPGDADYFERVNILAGSREEACTILADVLRRKALGTTSGPTYLATAGRGRRAARSSGRSRSSKPASSRRSVPTGSRS